VTFHAHDAPGITVGRTALVTQVPRRFASWAPFRDKDARAALVQEFKAVNAALALS
jgi:hypothetical protein